MNDTDEWFREVLSKPTTPIAWGDRWRVCNGGYQIKGRGESRCLVSAYDAAYETGWRWVRPLEEPELVPDFVKAYRIGLERSQGNTSELAEFEEPILSFVSKYGLGLTEGELWAGGPDETLRKYVVTMEFVEPLVTLFAALMSTDEAAVREAYVKCSAAHSHRFETGGSTEAVDENGETYEMTVREQALLGLGYVVGKWFHTLCFPFAIPAPHARHLSQLKSGWGISCLTGAIFWHLYQLLSGQAKVKWCKQCGAPIFNARTDILFCRNNGSCRNKFDNHSGRRAARAHRKSDTN